MKEPITKRHLSIQVGCVTGSPCNVLKSCSPGEIWGEPHRSCAAWEVDDRRWGLRERRGAERRTVRLLLWMTRTHVHAHTVSSNWTAAHRTCQWVSLDITTSVIVVPGNWQNPSARSLATPLADINIFNISGQLRYLLLLGWIACWIFTYILPKRQQTCSRWYRTNLTSILHGCCCNP
jgi:hypothetical protein